MSKKKSQMDMWGEYVVWLFERHIKIPKYYNMMLWALMTKQWSWFLDWDDLARGHAINIRVEYTNSQYDMYDAFESHQWDELNAALVLGPEPVSFLEVLVAMSIHMEMQSAGAGYDHQWARILLGNLDLLKYKGNPTMEQFDEINEIVDRCIWRTFEPNGVGSMFPLREPKSDQRKVPIFQQMLRYLEEHPNGPPLDRLRIRL